MISRGCPYSCSYCGNALFRDLYKNKGEYLRYRSVDNVMAELAYATKNFPYLDMINIEDDGFTALDNDYIKDFTDRYRRSVGLPLGLRISITKTNEEKIKYLANANAYVAVMGIQANQRINQEIFNRYIPQQKIIEVARLLKKYNIIGQYHLITGNPYATEEDMEQICEILSSLPKPYQLLQFKLAFFPNTPLRKKALADGLAVNELDGYLAPYGNYPENFPYLHKISEIAPYAPKFLTGFFLNTRRLSLSRLVFGIYHLFISKIVGFLVQRILRSAKLVILTKNIIFAGKMNLRQRH